MLGDAGAPEPEALFGSENAPQPHQRQVGSRPVGGTGGLGPTTASPPRYIAGNADRWVILPILGISDSLPLGPRQRLAQSGKLGHNQRLEEIEVEADIAESKALYRHDAALSGSSRWVDGLRASVRPLTTYTFFILFASVKGSGLYLLIVVEGLLIAEALPRIWDAETQALFAAVMSFWFGNRTLSKLRERR